jgi:hypothetical protein
MSHHIEWETSMENALSKAKSENKAVLIDFFNPG